MADKPQAHPVADLFAGAGMGLLLGTVVGLTTTPVVAGIVGALTSVLAVFLGLDGSGSSEGRVLRINAVRIGSFGMAAVIGFGLGLYARINNPLAEAPETQMARWSAAFPEDPTLAKQLMVYERTGIKPDGLVFGKQAPDAPLKAEVDERIAAAKSSILYSTLSEFDACHRLNPERLNSTEATLRNFTRTNAPDWLAPVKAKIEARPPEEQALALAATHDVLCILQQEEGK